MTVNTKLSKGTKRSLNKIKVDIQEDKIITKIDKYKLRKLERKRK